MLKLRYIALVVISAEFAIHWTAQGDSTTPLGDVTPQGSIRSPSGLATLDAGGKTMDSASGEPPGIAMPALTPSQMLEMQKQLEKLKLDVKKMTDERDKMLKELDKD